MTSPADHPRHHRSARSPNARSFRAFRTRLAQRAADLTAGGSWTYQLRPAIRRSLRWFWFDGLMAASADTIVGSYLSLFVLALGGNAAQVGLTSSLSNLSAAILLLPGAAMAERLGHHRRIVVACSITSRSALLLMALVPLFLSGPAAIAAVIALAVAHSAFGNLSVPAWTPLTANLVPLQWRGRYFSSRNIAMVVGGMVATYLAGWLITLLGVPRGYQAAMASAFAIGMGASYAFWRIEEDPSAAGRSHPQPRAARRPLLRGLLASLRGHPAFLAFCLVSAVWNFSIMIGGPFFNVFLVEGLAGTASTVGLLAVMNSLAALPGYRLFGRLIDRWGPRKVQVLTGLLLPIAPLIWVVASAPWHVIPANIIGGFLWAGFNVAALSFQLTLIPRENMPRWSALVQILVLASAAAGAAVGGVIAQRWGYRVVFVLTALGRFVSALLLARFVKPPAPQDQAPA